jgi:hypothetical protein
LSSAFGFYSLVNVLQINQFIILLEFTKSELGGFDLLPNRYWNEKTKHHNITCVRATILWIHKVIVWYTDRSISKKTKRITWSKRKHKSYIECTFSTKSIDRLTVSTDIEQQIITLKLVTSPGTICNVFIAFRICFVTCFHKKICKYSDNVFYCYWYLTDAKTIFRRNMIKYVWVSWWSSLVTVMKYSSSNVNMHPSIFF